MKFDWHGEQFAGKGFIQPPTHYGFSSLVVLAQASGLTNGIREGISPTVFTHRPYQAVLRYSDLMLTL